MSRASGLTFAKLTGVHLGSPLHARRIQDDTHLVVSEHVADGETLQEAVIVAAVPLADLAVHL